MSLILIIKYKNIKMAIYNRNIVLSPGSMFLPPTGALGASMYSVAMYGGLVLFGMFLLYDTQKIMKRAETSPGYYDPVNKWVVT